MRAVIRVPIVLAWLCSFCFSFAVNAPPGKTQPDDSYRLQASVLSAGGLPSTSENFRQVGSLGQPATIGFAQSGHGLEGGFWAFLKDVFTASAVGLPEFLVDRLLPNYPNPFNPTTQIEFILSAEKPVVIEVFDLRGTRVRSLLNDVRPAGRQLVMWDGLDDGGRPVASGVYFYRLQAGDYRSAQKMLLVK